MRIFTALIILFSFHLSHAAESPARLPDLQEVLDLQFSCNVKALNQLGWAKNPGLGHLTPKAWAIVSELKSQELQSANGSPRSRRFHVTFKAWDIFYCVNRPNKLESDVPANLDSTFELTSLESREDSGLALYNDNPPEKDRLVNYLFTEGGGDDLSVDYSDHLTCLIDKDQFLQGKAQVNFDQLCAGQPPAKRRGAERYLRWLQKALK